MGQRRNHKWKLERIFEVNVHENLWYTKTALRGKFVSPNIYIREKEKLKGIKQTTSTINRTT